MQDEETPLQQINRQLSLCNVCVFVIGFRYGSLLPKSEISFTHHEYLEAGHLGSATYCARDERRACDHSQKFDRGQLGEKNNELRQLLMRQHAGCLFESEVDYTSRLFSALEKLFSV